VALVGTVASLLAEHVMFRLSCVDRVFLQGYIPGLQSEGLVVRFLQQRGYYIPSPAGLRTIHDRLVKEIDAFVEASGLELVHFAKGQRKEDMAKPFQLAAERADREGVVMVGVAQERVSGWRGFRRGGSDSHPHFCYRRQSLWVNHYYFYVWDREWGAGFIKLCAYAPYPVWAWVNGHEWLKRQLNKRGVAFETIDNGLRSCAEPITARRVAGSLSAGHLRRFLDKWLAVLPSPLDGADRRAGYRYEFSLRQFEYSDTAVFDRPGNGRAWFEAAIRDHLDLGRPERVSLVVDRRITRRTPGRFATKVVTRGVDPQVQIHYRASKVKAYFKESRALRVETTVNNPDDFGVRRTLKADNWRQLRHVGADCNARFLQAVGEDEPPPPDAATLQSVVLPSIATDGARAPGLRFGDPRVTALLAAVACFAHVVGGLTNAGLCQLMTGLLGRPYNHRQATYDLRRLRRKGFIERMPGRNLYRVTARGRALACFLTKLSARVVVPVLAELEAPLSPPRATPRPIVTAWRSYDTELQALLRAASLAA
jgi:DNA-binding PadR family transcriptional regulator